MRLIIRWLIIAASLAITAWLLPGIHVEGERGWLIVLVMAAVLGLVNAFIRPVLVFESAAPGLATVLERTRSRGVECSIFTQDMFGTGNDTDNRAAVARVAYAALDLAGLAFHAERRVADKILKGVSLHS